MTNFVLKNLKAMPYGGAEAVVSQHSNKLVEELVQASSSALWDTDVQDRFLEKYRKWISESKLNALQGLDNFPITAYSNGATESFDKFYLDNSSCRFRCFRGEYMYHMASWRNYFNWLFLEDGALNSNDAVVISLPFSDTGNIHQDTNDILDQALELNVPVLIDCAFFGCCSDINFDLSHPAIKVITFSLSKSFPVPHLRIGMRLTRIDDDDSLLVTNKTKYTNRIGASVGEQLIDIISADWNSQQWQETQYRLCQELGVTPSNTVLFGVDTQNKYSQYNRGGKTSRLNLAKYLVTGALPNND